MPTQNNKRNTPTQQSKSTPEKIDRNRLALQDAFDYQYQIEDSQIEQEEIDNERAVRAVAFLLDYSAYGDNQTLPGETAVGFARVLDAVASDMARTSQFRTRIENQKLKDRR